MQLKIKIQVIALLLLCGNLTYAQGANRDSVLTRPTLSNSNWQLNQTRQRFPFTKMAVPAFMIAYGFTTLNSHGLKDWNKEIREDIWIESPHKKNHIDNLLQFSPAIAVYGLNMAGIKGKNNFKDRSMIYLMSNVLVNASVFSIKKITHVRRPDGSAYNSFPSGHTAEAFASAEFLHQEYKDVSPWYGIAGYAAATATGLLRVYNNKHWLSDVVTGAGIGIASTKIAYWLYPKFQSGRHRNSGNTIILPYYNNGGGGLAMVCNLGNNQHRYN